MLLPHIYKYNTQITFNKEAKFNIYRILLHKVYCYGILLTPFIRYLFSRQILSDFQDNFIYRQGGIFTIYNQILKEIEWLNKLIVTIQNQLRSLPDGKIFCSRTDKRYKWYHSDGHKQTYIPKSDRAYAEKLALKKYLTHLLQESLEEKNALEFYLRHHKQSTPHSEQMLTEHPEYQKLLSPFFKPASQVLADWANAPYERNPNYEKYLTQKTSSGILVRSKSEAIIDMILYLNKIPFRYECALKLGDVVYYPDFTIRHPKTGETYYWEHFGKADDPAYKTKNIIPKLNTYISNNIIPSINLITTYETKDHPLDPDFVQKIVEYYFL